MTEEKVSYPEFLRLLADFMESHPLLPRPTMYYFEDGVLFQLEARAKEALRSIGSFEKQYTGDSFFAKRKLGGWELTFSVTRASICRKIVVGTRVEPEHYVPGTEGHIVSARVVEDVKWECDDPILTEEPVEDIPLGKP